MTLQRDWFFDYLRLWVILCVVFVHTSVTYSDIGGWYYIDPISSTLDTGSLLFFALFNSFNQAYFMGILFLVGGYFAAQSLSTKSRSLFVRSRFQRLIVPAFIYSITLAPLTGYMASPQSVAGSGSTSILNAYFHYIISLQWLGESGPLWFTVALFFFSLIYSFTKMTPSSNSAFPKLSVILSTLLGIGGITFLVRLIQPIGTSVLNMQLCFFPAYILLFYAGTKCFHEQWLLKITYEKTQKWLFAGMGLGIPLWFVLLLLGGALTEGFDPFMGGFNLQSLCYAIWEAFIALSMSIGLLGFFRQHLNKPLPRVGLFAKKSFGLYFLHPPILVGLSLLLTRTSLSPIFRFLIAGIGTFFICYSVIFAYLFIITLISQSIKKHA